MTLLGTHRTMTVGVSAGVTPSATLATSGLGEKLRLDLGAQVLLIALGNDPRAALEALDADIGALLRKEKP